MSNQKREFNPTHYQDITSVVSLHIEIALENGDYYVYGAFYDGLNQYFDKVTRSLVRTDKYGHAYFFKSQQRYYLVDFMKKTPF